MSSSAVVYKPKQEKETRLCRMMGLIIIHFVYMLAELIVGAACNSLTLMSDAFHMISDTLSMIIGYVTIKMGKKARSSTLTFGYKRSEILGAFFNASFLVSTAFFMLTEAVEKFFKPEEIENVDLVLYVAIGGIVVNIIGMVLSGGEDPHGHHHHHGGHDHHDHDHEHEHEEHDHDHCESSCESSCEKAAAEKKTDISQS